MTRRYTASTWPGRPAAGEAESGLVTRVAELLAELRRGGAQALRSLALALDGREPEVFGPEAIASALAAADPALVDALRTAAARIREFQVRAVPSGFRHTDAWGNRMGVDVVPLDRAGVYVPGGRAPYPSTVLMAAVTARAAGVREVVVCTPDPGPAVLAACAVAGVDRVFRVGGAQAIGAMAYGVPPVPRVDKVVGPGNRWVTEAKRQVYGTVDVDGLAGPSEIAVVADDTADPAWVSADLLAQAEHGPESFAVLFTPDASLADRVAALCAPPASPAATAAVVRGGDPQAAPAVNGAGVRPAPGRVSAEVAIVLCGSLAEAVALADALAPEHLSLQCRDAAALGRAGRRAGSVFIGPWAPVAAGDYAAGTNHVLPTGGTARFASALSAAGFVRHVEWFEGAGADSVGAWSAAAQAVAAAEGFLAHARSLAVRGAGSPTPPPAEARPYVPAVPAGAARLDLNENPLGWPPGVWDRVVERLRACEPNRYPREAARLRARIADYAGLPPEWVLVGNGSDELILAALGGLQSRARRVIIPSPTFGMYRILADALGIEASPVPLRAEDGWELPVEAVLAAARGPGESLCVLCRPNNPTGNLWPAEAVRRLLDAGVWTLVDEAYYEFCGDTLQGCLGDQPRLVLLRTLSKAFAIAGLRVGYALGRPDTLAPLRQVVQPWAVGVFSQAAAEVALAERDWMRGRVAAVVAERERLTAALASLPGIAPYPSAGNYVLFRVDPAASGREAFPLYDALAARGVVLRRWVGEPALADKLRVTVGTSEEDDRFLAALRELLAG